MFRFFGLRTADCGLRTADCGLRTADCGLQTTPMPRDTFKYTNGEVTIIWKPGLCIHSAICFHGLPDVFDPQKRPWVNPQGSTTERIIQQIRKCPSGALSYSMNQTTDHGPRTTEREVVAEENSIVEIQILPNGPISIKNSCLIKHSDGREERKEANPCLCRCGASKTKPYCDGSHKRTGFVG